jgi:hypothetical protein
VGGDLFRQGLSWNRPHGGAYPLLEQVVKNIFLPFPPLLGNIDLSEHARYGAKRSLAISIQLKPTPIPHSILRPPLTPVKPPAMIVPIELAPSRPRKPLRHLLTALALPLAALDLGQLVPCVQAQLPVTADLKLHLDASQLTGLSDGATVTTWTDMSGLGNHAPQTAGTPIYKTGVLNGKPVIRFNGASRFTTATIKSFGTNVVGSSAVIGVPVAGVATIDWTVPYASGSTPALLASLAPEFTLSSGTSTNQTRPVTKQFYARDPNTNNGTIFYRGTQAAPSTTSGNVTITPGSPSDPVKVTLPVL